MYRQDFGTSSRRSDGRSRRSLEPHAGRRQNEAATIPRVPRSIPTTSRFGRGVVRILHRAQLQVELSRARKSNSDKCPSRSVSPVNWVTFIPEGLTFFPSAEPPMEAVHTPSFTFVITAL